MEAASPDGLGPGTLLGAWKLEGRVGRGTYGAVYRAALEGKEEAPKVALKLAVHPRDERFEREAELLSRIRHPRVPKLVGRGVWEGGPWNLPYPYVVMEWVEGMGLYEWGRQRNPSSRQVVQVLAQLAQALGATHGVKGLHRDVKGDNVLVGPVGEAWLMDFGCGSYEGARPLTEGPLAPGTRPYRSPQALRHLWEQRKGGKAYEARAADDVYALGVTAYRLVTGQYPPPGTDLEAKQAKRQGGGVMRAPAHALNRRVSRELSALIERMLEDAPEKRGGARELGQALERVAQRGGAEEDLPLQGGVAHSAPTVRVPVRSTGAPRWRGLALVVPAGVVVLAYLLVAVSARYIPDGSWKLQPDAGLEDAGRVGLADAAVETAIASRADNVELGESWQAVSLDMPKGPLKGQKRAPCRPKWEVEVSKACWVQVGTASPPCGNDWYEWKGFCYVPVIAPERPNTSDGQ
ncbi:protein kinase domain-containing protein [Stigmatella aurantiaca]|uniref:Protein kinase n=1 Tax=Stigmatella aurantiaca (strain DW4/3-1) TaxID=378806 RepID=Q08QN8_STIAD|nr:protein kinase [Stigmatella aurantiaca]ADO72859.1 Protein kinase [Stigmatella aurantiaca DW4/3-1]EAU62800.1 protein kinase [Stigmatella aurantiaca DW4/3-1]